MDKIIYVIEETIRERHVGYAYDTLKAARDSMNPIAKNPPTKYVRVDDKPKGKFAYKPNDLTQVDY